MLQNVVLHIFNFYNIPLQKDFLHYVTHVVSQFISNYIILEFLDNIIIHCDVLYIMLDTIHVEELCLDLHCMPYLKITKLCQLLLFQFFGCFAKPPQKSAHGLRRTLRSPSLQFNHRRLSRVEVIYNYTPDVCGGIVFLNNAV